jgi:hypothetical protein
LSNPALIAWRIDDAAQQQRGINRGHQSAKRAKLGDA